MMCMCWFFFCVCVYPLGPVGRRIKQPSSPSVPPLNKTCHLSSSRVAATKDKPTSTAKISVLQTTSRITSGIASGLRKIIHGTWVWRASLRGQRQYRQFPILACFQRTLTPKTSTQNLESSDFPHSARDCTVKQIAKRSPNLPRCSQLHLVLRLSRVPGLGTFGKLAFRWVVL